MCGYHSHITESIQLIPYTKKEEQLALFLRYKEMLQDDADRGRFFVKNRLKWISNIKLLKAVICKKYKRDIDNYGLLNEFKYDVNTY